MFDLWKRSRQLSLALATTWIGLFAAAEVRGAGDVCGGGSVGCLPPTPCPCSADGICRPNRREWGFNPTRWRLWPGEQLPKQPTPSGEGEAGGETPLEPFERPPAIKEDVRGPSKTKSAEPGAEPGIEGGAEAEGIPRELPEVDLPEPDVDPLQDFDLQGRLQHGPQQEDAPPALPRSMRMLSPSRGTGSLVRQAAVQTTATARRSILQKPTLQEAAVQADADQPQGTTLRLINPTAKVASRRRQEVCFHANSRSNGSQIE